MSGYECECGSTDPNMCFENDPIGKLERERDIALAQLAEIRFIIQEDHVSPGEMIEDIWAVANEAPSKENTP